VSHTQDVRQLVRKLRHRNYVVEETKRGSHWEVRTKAGERVATFPSTPGDRRWKANALADIRRWERAKGMSLTPKALHFHVPRNTPRSQSPGQLRKMSEVRMITITVQPGDTLSGIAAQYGTSYQAIASASGISNPNVLSVGETLIIPSGGSWAPSAPSASSLPSTSSSTSSSPSGGGSGYHIPGMSDALASCIAFHESTNGQASPNVFQIMPSSGYSGGGSLAQQEATAGQIWATQGPSAWAADAGVCPGA